MKKFIVFSFMLVLSTLFQACQEKTDQEVVADGQSGATKKSNSNILTIVIPSRF